jgi:hypothetical protein
MKKFKYEKYDYAFLYGLLTEEQRKEVQSILDKFIGCPNNETNRNAIEVALNMWMMENNINIKGKLEIS